MFRLIIAIFCNVFTPKMGIGETQVETFLQNSFLTICINFYVISADFEYQVFITDFLFID